MSEKRRVLVTDGEQRNSLATVRSLGRAGYDVFVTAGSRRSMAGASRFARDTLVVADAVTSPTRFTEQVRDFVHARDVDVVIPISDPALLTLAARREELGRAIIPWPDVERVRRICDKAAVLDAARGLGIAVPTHRLVHSRDQALAAARELRWPVVLKPTRTVRLHEDGGMTAGLAVRHVADEAALLPALDDLGPAAFPLLVQERIVGPGVGICLLVWDGRLIARFAHRRVREWPASGGVSVYAESIDVEPALFERSLALLKRFDWFGVAMVEYKVDAVTGTPYLMEVNGRLWGSLQLAIDAGVGFPRLLVAVASGDTVEPVLDYRRGLRIRWWWGDVNHWLSRLKHPPARLGMPPGTPEGSAALREFIAAGLPHRDNDVLRADDPMPFVVETADAVGAIMGRVWRRVRRNGDQR